MSGVDREQCFYCDAPLSRSNTENDHFPIPQRHGGTVTVPCCTTCHDMKDRFDLGSWPSTCIPILARDFPNISRETRIFIAKATDLIQSRVWLANENTKRPEARGESG